MFNNINNIHKNDFFIEKYKNIYNISRCETFLSKKLFLDKSHIFLIKRSEQINDFLYFEKYGIPKKLKDYFENTEVKDNNFWLNIAIELVNHKLEDHINLYFTIDETYEIKKALIELNSKWFIIAHSIVEKYKNYNVKSNYLDLFKNVDVRYIEGVKKWFNKIFYLDFKNRNIKNNFNVRVSFEENVKVFTYKRSLYDRNSINNFQNYLHWYEKPYFKEIISLNNEKEIKICKRRPLLEYSKSLELSKFIEELKNKPNMQYRILKNDKKLSELDYIKIYMIEGKLK